MHKPLKNRTYLGKQMFFNLLGTNFLVPNSGHQREKQPVSGPAWYLKKNANVFFCVFQTNLNKVVNIFCTLSEWTRNVQMIQCFRLG